MAEKTTEPDGRSGGYHHGNLRAALIAAATAILKEEGAEALTVRGAARAAGVSQTAPYRHFKDKAALLAALATEGFRGLTARMRAESKDIDDPVARLTALGRGYVLFAVEHPAYLRLMFGPAIPDKGAYPELGAAAGEAFMVLAGATGERIGEPLPSGPPAEPPEGDVRIASLAGWSLVHGLAYLIIDGQIRPEMPDGSPFDLGAFTDLITRRLK